MRSPDARLTRAGLTLFFVFIFALASAFAQSLVSGIVTDPSGAVVQNAQMTVMKQGKEIATGKTGSDGRYSISAAVDGRCDLRVTAASFATLSRPIDIHDGAPVRLDLILKLDKLSQEVTVAATGVPVLQKNIGSAVTVLEEDQFQHTRDLEEALRLIPGAQVTQTGQAGGATSLFLRGGNSDANKVLIDGISVNDIGGAVNLANFASAGIQRVEVLGGPNGATYGADAMAGVVSLSTPHGTTPLPEVSYLGEGGNFATYHQEGTLSGRFHPFDYFADYSRFDSANGIARNEYHDGTLSGNFGWALNAATELRATVHHDDVASGQPNALLLYGIADNAKQANEDSYAGVTLDNQTTERWHNSVRYGLVRLRALSSDFSPTGIPQTDGDGDLLGYLGAPVTIRGANGYVVSGQAQYQYVETYPNFYATSTDRDFVAAQSDYRFNPHLVGLFGFKYEDERGYSGSPATSIDRGIYDYTVQVSGDLFGRLHYVAGSGLEKNELFGFAATPRAAVAYDFVRGSGAVTKLRASFGKGIKEPALSDQESSLYALLAALNDGQQLISQYHVGQIGAENSRSYDGGVDEVFADGRSKLSLTLFHSEYTNGIEYIPQQGLTELGVPAPVVAQATYGSTVNSQAFRAQGVELSGERQIAGGWFVRGGYTYLDAVVQRSFSSDALGPSFNPNFPAVPIGVYSPLVGARPFRRAPHTGYFGVSYERGRFSGLFTGTLVSRRDDSDFLAYDANYEGTLLLPNRNLDPGYERLNLALNYAATRRITVFTSLQNLLSQSQSEAFGYPALPFTFRSGVKISFGGESWKWR
jgi:iron complex outermembrane receptor protein/vitamin B12 transporter